MSASSRTAISQPAPFKPVPLGPQKGAPPSLEFVAVDRLEVDPDYQRATDGSNSRKIIVGMVKAWDWSLCQPLVVSRRLDGRMMILDGQHRHAGARERGDIAHLPCVVLSGVSVEGEAQTFVDLNTRRQKLSQADIFNGMLAAGDPHAKRVAGLIDGTGWRVVRSSATTSWKPGDLHCAPMLARQVELLGDEPVHAALEVLRAAWPDTAVTCSASLLKALIAILRPSAGPARREQLARAMAAHLPTAWILRAETRRQNDPALSTLAALAAEIEQAADLARPRRVAPPQPVPLKPARAEQAPSSASGAFGSSGKDWCDQCEQLVDPARAAGCRSAFCKLKSAA